MSTTKYQQAKYQPICNLISEIQNESKQCQQCGKSFKKLSHFNRHLKERHTQSRDYICKHQNCGKSFKRGSHLKRHMISHTNIKNYKCSECIMSFGYKHHLDRHIKCIHLCQRLQCVQCGLFFKKKKAYTKHIQKIHLKRGQKTVDQQKLIDNCTVTKTIMDDIYDSSSQDEMKEKQERLNSDNQMMKKQEKMLFRCHFQNCLSAFEGYYQFKRHLQRIHPYLQ